MKTMRTIAALLSEVLSRDPGDVSAAFRLSKENGVAPIDIAKLAIACEEAFGLSLHDEEIAQWRTVGDVRAHIDQLLEAGMAEPVERTDEERTGWYYE